MTEIERIPVPLADRLAEELSDAQREALKNKTLIEPTEAERKNGWTAKTLTAYIAERQAGQSLAIDVNSLHRKAARKPKEQNHRYRPLRWRQT